VVSRYIDADKLCEYYEERHKNLCLNYGETDLYCKGYEDAMLVAENTPTADVVEIRHGHWQNENQRPKTSKFICSVCGGLAYYIQPNRDRAWIKHCPYKHCPNCGAIMDGERKER
jgi:hypothetical protein